MNSKSWLISCLRLHQRCWKFLMRYLQFVLWGSSAWSIFPSSGLETATNIVLLWLKLSSSRKIATRFYANINSRVCAIFSTWEMEIHQPFWFENMPSAIEAHKVSQISPRVWGHTVSTHPSPRPDHNPNPPQTLNPGQGRDVSRNLVCLEISHGQSRLGISSMERGCE